MIGPMTLSQALARQVAERGAAEAFVAPGERHTWAALQDGAQRIARGLHAAGVRPACAVATTSACCWATAAPGCRCSMPAPCWAP
ncbi:hypothetical protein [Achromobacter xylosoxidans]|uniref:hypothetical protein n=1 Tax=Alcaligenes xylosoxydans xylosoxydans TaxID=85698 RepID=UPI001F13A262|nr:hypothetical protein [Achromobacter xylosoxidans]